MSDDEPPLETASLMEAVTEDSALTPAEKETTVHFAKHDEDARVFTAEAGLMRRLLAHPEADVKALTVPDGDARKTVSPDEYRDGSIVGITVDLPVGALQVKLTSRSSPHHAEIITDRVLTSSESEETAHDR